MTEFSPKRFNRQYIFILTRYRLPGRKSFLAPVSISLGKVLMYAYIVAKSSNSARNIRMIVTCDVNDNQRIHSQYSETRLTYKGSTLSYGYSYDHF